MRIAVIGGGYIGIETACMMRRAGCEVSLVEFMEQIMPTTLDTEFSKIVLCKMATEGIVVRLDIPV